MHRKELFYCCLLRYWKVCRTSFTTLQNTPKKKELDIFSAYELVENVEFAIQNDRNSCEDSFKPIFTTVQNLRQKLEIPLLIPRRVKRQSHRDNYPCDDLESFFRQSIYVPYIEHLLAQLSERFQNQKVRYQSLWSLIPKYTAAMTSLLQVDNLLELYQQDVDSKVIAMPEILRWQESGRCKISADSSLPADASQALEFAAQM